MGFLLLAALSEKPPWWDVAWSTWALVAVGVIAAYVALRTLSDIKKQTTNTKIAADAALLNAQAIINAERAWIMVDLDWVPGHSARTLGSQSIRGGEQTFNTSAPVRISYTNEGKTIAWIDEKLACFQIVKELPNEPERSVLELLDPEPEWVGVKGRGQLDHTLQAEGQENIERSTSAVWGVIKYRDAFNAKHETVFGFRIRPDNSFVRLTGAAYNKTT